MVINTDDRNEGAKTPEKRAREPAVGLPGGVDMTQSFAGLDFNALAVNC